MAKQKAGIRKWVKWTCILLTALVVMAYLLVCCNAYISHWLVGFLSLAFPYLILVLLLLTFFWLMAKPIIACIPFITILLGWSQIKNFFAFNWQASSIVAADKPDSLLRIVDWNVQGFNGLSKNKEAKKMVRQEVAASILKQHADILCLQEFNTSTNGGANNIALFAADYPYYFFSKDYVSAKKGYQAGSIIFSKYPIVRSNKIRLPVGESLIYVDVLKQTDTIRIFTTHLQSYKFKQEDYEELDNISNKTDANLHASKNIFNKMKLAFMKRAQQANTVYLQSKQTPYASVLCGDFNDVPNSYTYAHIRGNRQDAFIQAQFGIGKTFVAIAPTLRIDFVLPDEQFLVHQFDLIDEGLSDHLMLVSDMALVHSKK